MPVVTRNLSEDRKWPGPAEARHDIQTDRNESACSGDASRHRTDAECSRRQRNNQSGDDSADERRQSEHCDVEWLKRTSHGRTDGLRNRSASGRPQRLQAGDCEQQNGESRRAYFFVAFVEDAGAALGADGGVVVVVVIGVAPGAVRGGGV